MTKNRPKRTVAICIWGDFHLPERADRDTTCNCQIREMCLGGFPLPIAGPTQTPTSTPITANASKMASDTWCGILTILVQGIYMIFLKHVEGWMKGWINRRRGSHSLVPSPRCTSGFSASGPTNGNMVDSDENGFGGGGGRRSTAAKTAITLPKYLISTNILVVVVVAGQLLRKQQSHYPNIQSAPMLVNILVVVMVAGQLLRNQQ